MDTGERRIRDRSELPTQPSIRLPLPSLPPALPRVPLARGWGGDDGGRAATGALPHPTTLPATELVYGRR